MADQPKRSAFDPEPAKVKAVPAAQREKSADSSDKTATAEPDHISQLRGSLRKLLGMKAEDPDFVEGGKGVSKAVDDAVASVPGNSTDY